MVSSSNLFVSAVTSLALVFVTSGCEEEFADADQSCPQGQIVAGIAPDGTLVCVEDMDMDTTYDGTDFATSDQACPSGMVMQGVNTDGTINCVADADTDTTYDGTDFATSGQGCTAGQVVTGIDASGAVTCAQDADTNTTYDGTDFATSNQGCTAGQVVTGIDASGAVTCAQDADTNTTYDGTNFATSNQSCTGTQKVTGISATGAITCGNDIDTDTDTDTTYTAGYGLVLTTGTFSVQTTQVMTRVIGTLITNGTEGSASFSDGFAGIGGTIGVDVADRNQSPETLYRYRCMKVNAVVALCMNLKTGATVRHFTFSPATQVMFSEPGFEIRTFIEGGGSYAMDVIIRNTSGNNLHYQLAGGT